MAVLPESMDRLDVNDAPGSFAKIQDYIRYMGERIEFSMRNMTKTVSAAGVSSAEIYILYQAQAQQLAALTSTVNGIAGNITALQKELASITEQLEAINGTLQDLDERVSALETPPAT